MEVSSTDVDLSPTIRAGYDAVAAAYARELYGELANKPFDRTMLDWLLARVRAASPGPICDIGCGPGQVARYLHDHGAEQVCGLDLSPEMVRLAAQLSPDIPFAVGDMLKLERVADATFGGIAGFYCIVNIPLAMHQTVFAEWRRVLRPNGTLVCSFHRGQHTVHADELFGSQTNLDFYFFEPEGVKQALHQAGLTVTEVLTREPYPNAEHPSERTYIFAERRT